MEITQFLGNYSHFFERILNDLEQIGIDINGYSLSHLGYKAATQEEYERVSDGVKKYSVEWLENEHNGRPISKLQLKTPLELPHGFKVSLIEVMPPKERKSYSGGLEHLGVVLGNDYEAKKEQWAKYIDGVQNQGPFCHPFYTRFNDGLRVKFYDISLKEAIEKEGQTFLNLE